MKAILTDSNNITVDILHGSKDYLNRTYDFKFNIPEDARGIYKITLVDDFIE